MKGLASRLHKWLALLMAIQILFWFVSGLVFAVFPIERVRSEHRIADPAPRPLPFGVAADGLLRLGSAGAKADRVEIRMLLDRPVALLGSAGRERLYDLRNGDLLSPIPMAEAARIAEADHAGEIRAARVTKVEGASPEYRGALPAWRVDFDDGAGRTLYVSATTGEVAARRSTLWRVYDWLWALHIMDWKDHEDFNSPLLVLASLLGLVVTVTGITLLPSRLGYTAWRRRRRAGRPGGSLSS